MVCACASNYQLNMSKILCIYNKICYNNTRGEDMTGRDIVNIRKKLLLLQEELADDLGVNICTIRFWEQGKRNMSIKSQRRVLEYCKNKGIEI